MRQAIALALLFSSSVFAAPAPPADAAPKASPRKKATTTVNHRLDRMQQALEAQQQQIEQLRQELQSRDQVIQQLQSSQNNPQAQQQLQAAQAAASEAQQKATAAQAALDEQKESYSRLNSDLTDIKTSITNQALTAQEDQKRTSALESLVGRFRFNGDVRVRGDSIFQSYTGCGSACADRNRARFRARFGVDGKLSDDFVGGFYLASGSLGDPTSANTTLTNFFDRHTVGIDRAYVTYNPAAHKWLSLTGGKWAYQWQRTSATFDPDINPEGFDEKISYDLHNKYVKNLNVQGIQLTANEISRGPDTFAAGGQVGGRFELGRWTATPSFTVLNWRNVDNIFKASAFAVQATSTGSTSSTTPVASIPAPGEGPGCAGGSGAAKFAPCTFAPNGMTNSTFVDSAGVVHFASGFLYTDLVINNTIKTNLPRLPVNVIVEYLNNLSAANHPTDYKGQTADWLGKQSHAYLADVSVGQTKNRNDFQVGYAFVRQEQDSAIASFTESDQRAPTNILQHRVYGLWKVRANTVASLTWWHGKTLNENLENAALAPGFKADGTSGHREPWLNRFLFDLIYSF